MNNPWGLSEQELKEKGGWNTAREICQQPQEWREMLDIVQKSKEQLAAFVDPLLAKKDIRIVFTGAGTSAYVGDTIAPYLAEKLGRRVEAVATTDIVANPSQWLEPKTPTILVSFARSGDSPESVAAYDLAEQLVGEIYQVVITCNAGGTLAKRAQQGGANALVLLTPPQTNDLGFAMTSSFTCMLIGGLLIFDLKNLEENERCIRRLADCGDKTLAAGHALPELAQAGYERIVFLGSGALRGFAQETGLKVMELASGRIVSVSESVMGFRHGPKSIINDKTIVVMLLSGDAYTRRYEMDFLRELDGDAGEFKVVTMAQAPDAEVKALSDMMLVVDAAAPGPWAADAYMALGYILYDHIFALAASMAQGITPDNPRPDGSVNRVVKGVTIHPFNI